MGTILPANKAPTTSTLRSPLTLLASKSCMGHGEPAAGSMALAHASAACLGAAKLPILHLRCVLWSEQGGCKIRASDPSALYLATYECQASASSSLHPQTLHTFAAVPHTGSSTTTCPAHLRVLQQAPSFHARSCRLLTASASPTPSVLVHLLIKEPMHTSSRREQHSLWLQAQRLPAPHQAELLVLPASSHSSAPGSGSFPNRLPCSRLACP